MRRKLVAMVVSSVLCAACGGGGGGGGGGVARSPSDPCQDLGYGPAAAGLAGEWNLTLTGVTRSFTLYDNGTFVDSYGGGRFPGFWGLSQDGKFTAVYSLGTECPPTGTVMTASGVTEADDRIAGKVVSSPMPSVRGDWEIAR